MLNAKYVIAQGANANHKPSAIRMPVEMLGR